MLDYRVEYKPVGDDWRIAGWFGNDLIGAVKHALLLLKQSKVEAAFITPEAQ